MTAGIVDIATATPGEHITNAYFDSIGLTDEWIRRRTGVAARWWMDPAEPLEDVAARVCAPLVARHRERVDIIALIVVSCSTGGKDAGYRAAGREESRAADRRLGLRHERGLQRLRLRHDLRACRSASPREAP